MVAVREADPWHEGKITTRQRTPPTPARRIGSQACTMIVDRQPSRMDGPVRVMTCGKKTDHQCVVCRPAEILRSSCRKRRSRAGPPATCPYAVGECVRRPRWPCRGVRKRVQVLLSGLDLTVAHAIHDRLQSAPPASSQDACACRRSCIRTWKPRSARSRAGSHTLVRNVLQDIGAPPDFSTDGKRRSSRPRPSSSTRAAMTSTSAGLIRTVRGSSSLG